MNKDARRDKEVKSIEIPTRHILALCEYPVSTGHINPPEEGCGEPAIAVWQWPNGGGQMFVCAEHDAIVTRQEEETIEQGDSEYGDYKDWGNLLTYINKIGEK